MPASTSLFIFSAFILLNLVRVSISIPCSTTSTCNSSDSFSVRFPFRLPQYQYDAQCGYNSNFTLSCSPGKQTLLNILNTGPFVITNIDYTSQSVNLTDPNGCLPQRFLISHLSSSPFSPLSSGDFTYYNCTANRVDTRLSSYNVTCMSNSNYTVLAIASGTSMERSARENNCTVIKSVSVPLNENLYFPTKYVVLYWCEPQCSPSCMSKICSCKQQGGSIPTACQYTTAQTSPLPKRKSASLTESQLKAVMTLCILVPLIMMFVLGYLHSRSERRRTERRRLDLLLETQIIRSQPSTPTTIPGLSGPVLELNPLFVLGEGDVLLEPNVSPCAICLSDYKAGDMLRTVINCNHYFHSQCIDEWLKMRGNCPLCRNIAG